MKKTLTLLFLMIMSITMAFAVVGCKKDEDNVDPDIPPTPTPTPTVEKKEAEAISDLKVSTKGIVTFTANDGFTYQLVIDGEDKAVEKSEEGYDITEFIDATKTHTVAVYSKENDTYKKSANSNVVNVKATDTSTLCFAISADKKVSFTSSEGCTYYLDVNGKETAVTSGQDVSSLVSGNSSMIVKLVIKGNVSGDTVTLDGISDIITFVWHKAITDLKYDNGVITFSNELNFTYNLYSGTEMLKENVKSGDNVATILSAKNMKELPIFIKVKEKAEMYAFVSDDNIDSNTVTVKFLSTPSISATVANGVITANITSEDSGVEGIKFALTIDGIACKDIKNGDDISAFFTKKGEAKLTIKASANGYVSSSESAEETVNVPDYNRFHYSGDTDKVAVGGIYGTDNASVKVLEEGAKIISDTTVDLSKASKTSAITVINNPSDHPAGIGTMKIDIVSGTDESKFIRIVVTSGNNGYNAHIYGGYGVDLLGCSRVKVADGEGNMIYGLVDANYGEINDYNILWVALGLGKLEGDQGNGGWNYSQKRQLTLVYDSGKIGYYSPACEFVPVMDLSGVENFNVDDFKSAKLVYTFDSLISTDKTGYTNATHTIEIYGTGVDYTSQFRIDEVGFDITGTDKNKYIGIYLFVTAVGQDGFVSNNGWPALGGTYKDNILVNGEHYDGIVMKLTDNSSRPYLDIESVKSLVENAAFFKSDVCIEIPANSTFTYGEQTWTTNFSMKICSKYAEDGTLSWQVCTHDSHEYTDKTVVTFGDIKRSRYLGFEMHLKDLGGKEIALPQTIGDPKITLTVDGKILLNDAETTSIPLYTSDWNGGVEGKYLLWINTESIFANQAAFDVAKAAGTVYTITIKANTTLTCQGVKYFVAEDVSYKLSLKKGDYSWRVDDGIEDPLYTLDGTVHRSRWHEFEMHLTDAKGNDVALPQSKGVTVNGTVLLNGQAMSEPWFVTSDWDGGSTGNYLLSIKTSDGKVFADEAAFNTAKAAGTVYTITVKAGTILTIEGVEYPIVKDITYKLSLRNGEYAWREAEDLASAKISSNQTRGYQYINFEFIGSSNGFETENWDVFITVADGAKFNDDTLALKRGGYGDQALFFIDNTVNRTAVVGDKITFKAGDYYNATTKLGITLEKDYVLEWNGSAWVLDTTSET